MTDVDEAAEQAVLGSLLTDEHALDEIADLFRPELFGVPAHAEVAAEVLALAAERKPLDPVLVADRLTARNAGVDRGFPLALAAAIGTTANVRHYAEALESAWARRAAKRAMLEALRESLDCTGEEYVARVAERLSAIETKRSRPAQRLGKLMLARLDRREEIAKNPALLQLWPTGYSALDALVGGFKPGELFTIAARPGVGKSAFVASVLRHLALRQVPVGVFQLEDYGDALADRTFMREGRIASTMLRDSVQWGTETWARAGKAVQAVADWPVYVDDQHGRTIHDLTAAMRRMHREHGVRVFFLDNVAEVVVDLRDRERKDEALGRIARQYRDAAKALGAAPVLVVHLNRDVEKRGDGRPRLSDLKNSGDIEDASHVVSLLWRPENSDKLLVDVAKNRAGPPGEIELLYVRELMEVREAA